MAAFWLAWLAFALNKIFPKTALLDSTISCNDFLSDVYVFHDDEHATLAYVFEGLSFARS